MGNKEKRNVSSRAETLLKCEEGIDVEFKCNAQNIKGEDLVAFANSENGGVILIGIDEFNDENGRQKTKIVGCSVGDEAKLSLMNKAEQCVPPVNIKLYIENEDILPFYRLEISPGKNKPYCTSGGTFKIRRDGLKVPIHPKDLLDIYITQESGKFLLNFQNATKDLNIKIEDINKNVSDTYENISKTMDLISGGDSFARISMFSHGRTSFIPSGKLLVQGVVYGKTSLHDITILIQETSHNTGLIRNWTFEKRYMNPKLITNLGFIDIPHKNDDINYSINVFARNRVTRQWLRLNKNKDGLLIQSATKIFDESNSEDSIILFDHVWTEFN